MLFQLSFDLRFQFSKPAAFRQLDYFTKLSILCQALFSSFLAPVHFRAAVKVSPKGCRFATAYLYYHLHPKLSSTFSRNLFFNYMQDISRHRPAIEVLPVPALQLIFFLLPEDWAPHYIWNLHVFLLPAVLPDFKLVCAEALCFLILFLSESLRSSRSV